MALKNGYVTLDTEGKLFRVRDRAAKNKPYIVWGENLSYDDAHKLKELTCGAEKSRTARIEDMEIPLPDGAVTSKGVPYLGQQPVSLPSSLVTSASPPDPDAALEAARKRALAAARATAAQAQARHAATVQIPPAATAPPPNGESEIGDVPEHIEEELADLTATDGDIDLA